MDKLQDAEKYVLNKEQFVRGINYFEGHTRITIIENGKSWIHYDDHNIIVNNARKVMSHLIGDCDGDYVCINRFLLGGDNTLTGAQMLDPNQPEVTDTEIKYTTNLFTRNKGDLGAGSVELMATSYPDAPSEISCLFSMRILKTEGNIMDPDPTVYVAAGLVAVDDPETTPLLFASQTFPVITKTPQREILFEWEIRY